MLVPFPFTDLSSSKKRPALVVSPDTFNDQMQDVVLVAITSHLPSDHARSIEERDCVDGRLPRRSAVKLTKLFTMHSSLVARRAKDLRPP